MEKKLKQTANTGNECGIEARYYSSLLSYVQHIYFLFTLKRMINYRIRKTILSGARFVQVTVM